MAILYGENTFLINIDTILSEFNVDFIQRGRRFQLT